MFLCSVSMSVVLWLAWVSSVLFVLCVCFRSCWFLCCCGYCVSFVFVFSKTCFCCCVLCVIVVCDCCVSPLFYLSSVFGLCDVLLCCCLFVVV